jgi:hypothetical protein
VLDDRQDLTSQDYFFRLMPRANTASENAVSRFAVIFSSRKARWPFDSNEILCVCYSNL